MSAELSVTIFFLSIVFGLFILPLKVRLAQNEILNEVLTRCCWVVALWLLSLSTAIIVTIADIASMGVNHEIFFVMWMINFGTYLFMIYIVLSFLFRMLGLWQEYSRAKRMGGTR